MEPKIDRILYATDLSQNAQYAFRYAVSMAEKYEAKITIVHIVERIPDSMNAYIKQVFGAEEWEQKLQENKQRMINEIKSRVEKVCNEKTGSETVCLNLVEETIVKRGVAAHEILGFARKLDSDMIILGSHGNRVVMDAFMGNTARKVVQGSPIPVLVVRLPES